MEKRIVLGCVTAAATLLTLGVITKVLSLQGGLSFSTPLGPLPLLDVLTVLLAMAAGGFIARNAMFRWAAIGLVVLMWLLTLSTLASSTGLNSSGPLHSVQGILKYNALAIVLSLIAAWGGAFFGERWKRGESGPMRWRSPRSVGGNRRK